METPPPYDPRRLPEDEGAEGEPASGRDAQAPAVGALGERSLAEAHDALSGLDTWGVIDETPPGVILGERAAPVDPFAASPALEKAAPAELEAPAGDLWAGLDFDPPTPTITLPPEVAAQRIEQAPSPRMLAAPESASEIASGAPDEVALAIAAEITEVAPERIEGPETVRIEPELDEAGFEEVGLDEPALDEVGELADGAIASDVDMADTVAAPATAAPAAIADVEPAEIAVDFEVEDALILESTPLPQVSSALPKGLTQSEGWHTPRPEKDLVGALLSMLGREAGAAGGPRRAHLLYLMGLLSGHLAEDEPLAIHALQQAVELAPESGAALWILVELLISTGRRGEAAALLATHGGRPGACLRAGALSFAEGDVKQALALWGEGARRDRGAPAALALLINGPAAQRGDAAHLLLRHAEGRRLRRLAAVEGYAALGGALEAQMARQALITEHLKGEIGPAITATVAWEEARGGDPALSLEAATTALACCGPEGHGPLRGRWQARRMWALERMGRLDEALEAGLAAASLLPEDLYLLDRLSALAHRIGEYGLQRQILARIGRRAQTAQGRARAWYERGLIADRHLGLEAEAVEDLQQALAASPEFTPALAALGRLSGDQGRWAEMKGRFDEELSAIINARDPDEAARSAAAHRAFRVARLCEVEIGDRRAAAEYDRQALRLMPELESAFAALEAALIAAGDWRALVSMYEDRLEASEGEAPGLIVEIARLRCLALGDDAAAARACQRILAAELADPRALSRAGAVYHRLGHWAAAIEARWQAFGEGGEAHRWTQGHLAAALQEVEGDAAVGAAEALEMYRQLLADRPGAVLAADGVIRAALRLSRPGAAKAVLDDLPSAARGALAVLVADGLLAAGQREDAAAVLSDALDTPAGAPQGLWGLAAALHHRQGDHQAVRCCLASAPATLAEGLSGWAGSQGASAEAGEAPPLIRAVAAVGAAMGFQSRPLEPLTAGLDPLTAARIRHRLDQPALDDVSAGPVFHVALERALEAGELDLALEALSDRARIAAPQERRALHTLRLHLCERLEDEAGIAESAEALLALDPDALSPKLARLRCAVAKGDLPEMIRLSEALLGLCEPAEGARLLGRLAAEARRAEHPAAAVQSLLRRAVALDPELIPAWAALAELLEEAEDWRGLADLLRRRLETEQSEAARITTARLAEILSARLDAPGEALAVWSAWLADHPDDLEGRWAAAALATATGADQQATALMAEIFAAASGELKLRAGRALADALEGVGEIAAARACMRALVDLPDHGPEDDERLIRLSAQLGDWADVQALYGRLYARCVDPKEKSRRAHALGELVDRLGGDPRQAAGWFCRALSHDPEALISAWRMFDALTALPPGSVPADRVAGAIHGAHQALVSRLWAEPTELARVQDLTRLCRWMAGGEISGALVAAQGVSRWLEGVGQGERAPSALKLPLPADPFSEAARRALAPEEIGGPTRILFDALALVLAESLIPAPGADLSRLALDDGGAWAGLIRQITGQLGLGGVTVALFKTGERSRALEPVLAPAPGLLVGAARLLNPPEARARYEVARTLEGLRDHLILLDLVGPQLIAEAAAVLVGALRPELPWTATVALDGVSAEIIERLEIRAGLLPQRSRKVIHEAVDALGERAPDFEALARGARRLADRVALVACGDPVVALEAAADGADLARFLLCGGYELWCRDAEATGADEEVRL